MVEHKDQRDVLKSMHLVHKGMCGLNVADTERSIISFYTFFAIKPFMANVILTKTGIEKRSMKKMNSCLHSWLGWNSRSPPPHVEKGWLLPFPPVTQSEQLKRPGGTWWDRGRRIPLTLWL